MKNDENLVDDENERENNFAVDTVAAHVATPSTGPPGSPLKIKFNHLVRGQNPQGRPRVRVVRGQDPGSPL